MFNPLHSSMYRVGTALKTTVDHRHTQTIMNNLHGKSVTGTAKRGSYSLSNCTYLAIHNFTYECGTNLKFGHFAPLT